MTLSRCLRGGLLPLQVPFVVFIVVSILRCDSHSFTAHRYTNIVYFRIVFVFMNVFERGFEPSVQYYMYFCTGYYLSPYLYLK